VRKSEADLLPSFDGAAAVAVAEFAGAAPGRSISGSERDTMSGEINFTIDGVQVQARPARAFCRPRRLSNIYIPHLCARRGLSPWGSCRVCTVLVNGRPQAACIQPIAEGILVENDTENLRSMRRELVEMLFVEGNHFCPFCEKSGNCELQPWAYRWACWRRSTRISSRCVTWTPATLTCSSTATAASCARAACGRRKIGRQARLRLRGRGAHKHVAANSPRGWAGRRGCQHMAARSVPWARS